MKYLAIQISKRNGQAGEESVKKTVEGCLLSLYLPSLPVKGSILSLFFFVCLLLAGSRDVVSPQSFCSIRDSRGQGIKPTTLTALSTSGEKNRKLDPTASH